MDLSAVASFFDNDPVYDAYTGVWLFDCHTTPHDDHTSSGATARRRTMTTEPGTAPPARSAAAIHGETWLVGASNLDGFQGDTIRKSYGLRKATDSLTALTPGSACQGGAGTAFYGQCDYFRDLQDTRSSSDWDTMWNVFCPLGEPVAEGAFLRRGSALLHVRNTYVTVDGFLVAEADQLDADAVQTVTFAGAIDLVTELPAAGSTAVAAIQTDLQKFYRFRSPAEDGERAGERAVFIAKADYTPAVGVEFTMQGLRWRAAAIIDEQDAWVLRARRA